MIANAFVNLLFRIWFKRLWRGMPSVSQVRRKFLLADKLSSLGRKNVIPQYRNIGGVDVEWLGENADVAKGIIIYLHGGGFAVRAKFTDRRFCHEISCRSGLSVVLVPYRLAPEYPYPHGLNDCCRVYETLIDAATPPGNVIVIGHSAGANYALALLMRARNQGLPQPVAAIVLSAPTDMTAQSPSVVANAKRDVMQGPNIWRWVQKTYLATTPLDHPDVSPLFGDWAGLAPIHFHVSDSEVLLDDSRRAVDRARESGTEAHLSIWHDVPHNFYFLDFLAESRQFHEQLVCFLEGAMASKATAIPES
ncbi:esterase/lipase [Herbaspirillum sp. CF444]|uniref:alpha/beta hydrolase n=1 Tax=Herbaspirillum sp. CF444 TaxID=1144319 RepID=UPI0002728479|nr:alpha/beta hydrolase [Herbaspirillum sp. CF444]EJL81582.1 esterase/lipase [Herbaspirillum sp. CF444]